MSTSYFYVTANDPVQRRVDGVERVTLDGGFVLALGSKKRVLLAMSESSLVAAWQEESSTAASHVVDLVSGTSLRLSKVRDVEVRSNEFGLIDVIILSGKDDDLPIALVAGAQFSQIRAAA
jgi:hypothetical protein